MNLADPPVGVACWLGEPDHSGVLTGPPMRTLEAAGTSGPIYYPPANRTQWFGDKYATATYSRVDKVLLHTTETAGGWPGYAGGASAPNLTYDPWRHAWRQHFGLNQSARALRDPAGTVVCENRDNVVQVEVSCYCDPVLYGQYGHGVAHLDDRALRDIAAFLRFMHDQWGVPLVKTSKPWLPYPKSYGNSPARMTGPEYDAFRGILAHMHASGNSHGDVGALPIDTIMAYALGATSPAPPPEVDDMPTVADLLAARIASPDERLNGWTLAHLLEWQGRMALAQQAATVGLAKAIAALAAGQKVAQADLDDIQATLVAVEKPAPPPLPAPPASS